MSESAPPKAAPGGRPRPVALVRPRKHFWGNSGQMELGLAAYLLGTTSTRFYKSSTTLKPSRTTWKTFRNDVGTTFLKLIAHRPVASRCFLQGRDDAEDTSLSLNKVNNCKQLLTWINRYMNKIWTNKFFSKHIKFIYQYSTAQ